MIDSATMRQLTTHHESAHAVLAHLSKFHSIIGAIQVASQDTGDTFVSVSKKKLARAGKPVDNSVVTDPDYVADASIVYLAGYAAELYYSKLNLSATDNLVPDRQYSENDYSTVRRLIEQGLLPQDKISDFEAQALTIVSDNWKVIETLAERIIQSKDNILDAVDAIDFLDSVLGTNSWTRY